VNKNSYHRKYILNLENFFSILSKKHYFHITRYCKTWNKLSHTFATETKSFAQHLKIYVTRFLAWENSANFFRIIWPFSKIGKENSTRDNQVLYLIVCFESFTSGPAFYWLQRCTSLNISRRLAMMFLFSATFSINCAPCVTYERVLYSQDKKKVYHEFTTRRISLMR